MAERFADIGGAIRLCYETFGSEDDPPMLLIMGLGMQMIGWPDEFCEQLAGRGFYVVRFDNRDTGVPRGSTAARRPRGSCCAAGSTPSSTRSQTWRPTRPACSVSSASRRRTSSARRWAG